MMNASALGTIGNNSYSYSQQGLDLRDQPVTSGLLDPTGGEAFMQCNHEVRTHNSNNANNNEIVFGNPSHLSVED